MKSEQNAVNLIASACEQGLLKALCSAFGPRITLSLPLSENACKASIDELGLSVRASNALKRTGILTVGETVYIIETGGLMHIRNLGKKTQNEIKTRVMKFGYDKLNEKEKRRFLHDIIEKNCGNK